jgi:ribosomal protein S18 acetylase RimI-like enzyme
MPRVAIAPVPPAEHRAACRALFAHRTGPHAAGLAARCHDLLAAGELDPAGLFAARTPNGEIVAAALVQPIPGGLGLAWPVRAASADVEDALMAAASGWLRSRGVRVCQAFAAEDERPDHAPLLRHGFRRVTQVVHLRREVAAADRGLWSDTAASLAFEPYHPNAAARFAATLSGTYDGSLDVPEMNDLRLGPDLLAGFRPVCGFAPDWWQLAVTRPGREPAGVVFTEPGPEPHAVEVSYLGLLPAARGRGWGDELVRFALSNAARDGVRAVTLSVDTRNDPALRLYRRHGFVTLDRKDVYLALWPVSSQL